MDEVFSKDSQRGRIAQLEKRHKLPWFCSSSIVLTLLERLSYSLRHVENGPFWRQKFLDTPVYAAVPSDQITPNLL